MVGWGDASASAAGDSGKRKIGRKKKGGFFSVLSDAVLLLAPLKKRAKKSIITRWASNDFSFF